MLKLKTKSNKQVILKNKEIKNSDSKEIKIMVDKEINDQRAKNIINFIIIIFLFGCCCFIILKIFSKF